MTNQPLSIFFKLSTILIFCFVLFAPLATVRATVYDEIKFVPNVTIPGEGSPFKAGQEKLVQEPGKTLLMIEYIQALYKFFVGIAGIIAVFMIVFGGVLWLFSGGSSDKISKAKEIIIGAISGLVLAVGSYLILFTVNPNLVSFNISIPPVPVITGQEKLCTDYKFTSIPLGNCGQKFNSSNISSNNLGTEAGCTFTKCNTTNEICVKTFLCSCKNSSIATPFALQESKYDSFSFLNAIKWQAHFADIGTLKCGEARFNRNKEEYFIGSLCPDINNQKIDSWGNVSGYILDGGSCFVDLTKKLNDLKFITGSENSFNPDFSYKIDISSIARCSNGLQ